MTKRRRRTHTKIKSFHRGRNGKHVVMDDRLSSYGASARGEDHYPSQYNLCFFASKSRILSTALRNLFNTYWYGVDARRNTK